MRLFVISVCMALSVCAWGAELDTAGLQLELEKLSKSVDGRLGACVQDARGVACTRGGERFSMQSVMKLLVGMAALEAVDHRGWKLADEVIVRKADLSLYVQPLAKLVGEGGFRTTIGDLVRRAIIDSDSAATDMLIARLGGTAAVQDYLRRNGVEGVRIDRDERHLQTEIAGLTWRPEYVEPRVLERAMEAVPESAKAAAYARYQADVRDTATPRGMTAMLRLLADGKLLSPASTAFVMKAMEDCATFPDRLKGGLRAGWSIGHKTGSSGSWKGLTVATNDVGVLTAPDGTRLAVTAFVADSRAEAAVKAAAMAKITALAIEHYR